MTLALFLVALTAFFTALSYACLWFVTQAQHRRVARIILAEKHRSRLGVMRNKLMRQALERQVDVRGWHFSTLYSFLSTLMRAPSHYEAIVGGALSAAAQDATHRQPATEREAHFYLELADAFDQLCRDYNVVYRLVVTVVGELSGSKPAAFWMHVMAANRARQFKKVKKAQQAMEAHKALVNLGNAPMAAA